ncbi:MAG: GNAT family N-acetyltransferase [Chloroflexota bacterium]
MTETFILTISRFQPQDQNAAKALILAGLAEHWGFLDTTRNPDLNDIAASYAEAVFLVARINGKLVGTGALVPRTVESAEIVRMSVDRSVRRQGIGQAILRALLEHACQAGFRRITLETTASWEEVIAFYLSSGFRITHEQDGDVYFALDLAER